MPTRRETFLAWLWIKWDNFKWRWMPWCKQCRISKENRRLEKKLFGPN